MALEPIFRNYLNSIFCMVTTLNQVYVVENWTKWTLSLVHEVDNSVTIVRPQTYVTVKAKVKNHSIENISWFKVKKSKIEPIKPCHYLFYFINQVNSLINYRSFL